LWFDAPFEIGGVVEEGVFLNGFCFQNRPDRHVSFSLVVARTASRRRIPLCRVDWRAISGGHSNPRVGSSPWRGIRVSDSHFHDFELNWLSAEERMRGRKGVSTLPLAKDLNNTITSFEELREFTGKAFSIKNIEVVERPVWEYDLFNDDDK
jgi:hypothetical protein